MRKILGYGLLAFSSLFGFACVSFGVRKQIRFIVVGNDPDGKLMRIAQSAAARWSAATGMDVQIIQGTNSAVAQRVGNTIRWATTSEMGLDKNGKPWWGVCDHDYKWKEIAIKISDTLIADADIEKVVAHEMGHAIARRDEHTASGVMRASADILLDENTLDFVCASEGVECSMFNPESAPPAPPPEVPDVSRWQKTEILREKEERQ